MARYQPTGTVVEHSKGYSARVRLGLNDRPTFALAVRGATEADKRALLLADIARRLVGMVDRAELTTILEEAGNARTAKDLDEVRSVVDAIESGETDKAESAKALTFAKFAEEWTSGRLRAKYPDHVREKDSTRDVQVLRDFINPELGRLHIPDVTLAHAEAVMAKLPATLAPRSRKLVAQCMRKVLSLAVYPGRYIATNPVPREWMPKVPKTANKAKAFLYPDEDAKLVACATIAIERRLAYGILAREGMRASELSLLRWRDVDLERGLVRLDENKTDDPRAWALSPDVVRTLVWWKKQGESEPGDLVLGLDLAGAPRWLRGQKGRKYPGDLRAAGVTRAELFARTSVRQPLRAHDLRATFVTISLANGKTEQWVTDRTGHKSSQMVAVYARQARTWSELGLGSLKPLDRLLPEMLKKRATEGRGGPQGGARKARKRSARLWTSIGRRSAPPGRLELPAFGLGKQEAEAELSGELENKPDRESADPRSTPLPTSNVQRTSNPEAQIATLERAIGRLTLALGEASDEDVPALVKERAALRTELAALVTARRGNVVDLGSRRR